MPRDTVSGHKHAFNKAPVGERIVAAAANQQITERERVVAAAAIDTQAPVVPLTATETRPMDDTNHVANMLIDIAATAKAKGEGESKTQANCTKLQAKPTRLNTVVQRKSDSQKACVQAHGAVTVPATTEESTVQNRVDAPTIATPTSADKTFEATMHAVPEIKHVDDPTPTMIPKVTARVPGAKAADDAQMKAKVETSSQAIYPELQAEESVHGVIAEGKNGANNVSALVHAADTTATHEIAAPRACVETTSPVITRGAAGVATEAEAVAAGNRIADMAAAVFSRMTAPVPTVKAREEAKTKTDAEIHMKDPGKQAKRFVPDNVGEDEFNAGRTLVKVPAASTIVVKEGESTRAHGETALAAGGKVPTGTKMAVDERAALEVQHVVIAQTAVVEGGKMGPKGDVTKHAEGSESPSKITRTSVVKSTIADNDYCANSCATKGILFDGSRAEEIIGANERATAAAELLAEASAAKAYRMAGTKSAPKVKQSTQDTLAERVVACNKEVEVACTAAPTTGTPGAAANDSLADQERTDKGAAVHAHPGTGAKLEGETREAGAKQMDAAQSADIARAKVNAGEVSTSAEILMLEVKSTTREATVEGKTASNKESCDAYDISATETVAAGEIREPPTTATDARVAVDARMAGETRVAARTKRIADAKAAIAARATARVAEAKATEDDKIRSEAAAKIRASADATAKRHADAEVRRADRVPRDKAVAEAKAANEARAAATARFEFRCCICNLFIVDRARQ